MYVRPENKSGLHPQLLQRWLLLQITKASWKKGTNCESFSSMWCWVVTVCLAQSSLSWRLSWSTCSSLSSLNAGLWLVRAPMRAQCGNTQGLLAWIGHSQVLSILKNLHSLSCSRAVCFMQPANTVELVLPVLWYFTLEYLSHSFPFHETMNDAGKMHLNKAGSMSLYQWFQINAFSHCHSDSLVTEKDLAQWHFARLCVSGCTKANYSQ